MVNPGWSNLPFPSIFLHILLYLLLQYCPRKLCVKPLGCNTHIARIFLLMPNLSPHMRRIRMGGAVSFWDLHLGGMSRLKVPSGGGTVLWSFIPRRLG
jgi:hypothetical protein